jgi:integrase
MSVSYRPLSKTRWLIRVYRSSDGQSAYRTVRTQKEAMRLQGIYVGDELKGVDVVAALKRTRQKVEHPLVRDAIPAWITTLVEQGELCEGSAVNYHSRFRKWVAPAIGAKTVDQVTEGDLGAIIETVKAAGAVSAIKHCLNPMRSFYRRYRKDHPGIVNPTLDLRDYIGRAQRRERKSVKIFTHDEQDKIMAVLGRFWALFTLVAFETGLRWNEVAALCRDAIDFERRLITVQRGVSLRRLKERPKTPGSRREVPVSPVLLRALQAHLETVPAGCELVFPNSKGKVQHYGSFHERWKKVLKAAGVRHRGFHPTRHSFTTRMRDIGVKLEIVSKWLGHSSVAITADVYSHIDATSQAEAVRLKDRVSEAEVTS